MKLTITDKNEFESVRAAFERREPFILTGAGITANFLADQLTFFPTGLFGYRPSLELTFEQVSEAASSKRWDGQGLPPVGTVCEIKRSANWTKVEVIAHYKGDAVIAVCSGVIELRDKSELRAIPTPEQTEAEAKQKAVAEMIKDSMRNDGSAVWTANAEALYDAGYRKP